MQLSRIMLPSSGAAQLKQAGPKIERRRLVIRPGSSTGLRERRPHGAGAQIASQSCMRDQRAAVSGLGNRQFTPEHDAVIRPEDGLARGDERPDPRLPTSERLLDTAATLFWSKGYAATTTREIAAVLGVRKASLYHHVRRKEDLLYDICVASLEHIRQAVQSAVSAVDDPLERVRVLVRAHVTAMLVHQDMHSTMLTELRALSAQRRDEIVKLRDGYERVVRRILADAQQAGMLRADVPAKYLCLSLLDQLNWAIFWFNREGELSSETLADVLTTIYMNGVIEPLLRPSVENRP